MSILVGDCVEVMAGLEPCSVDAVVCDPPYGLEFMGKEWDRLQERTAVGGRKVGLRIEHGETESGNPWASERSSYGAPKKNPRCRKCGGYKISGSKQCACEHPDWDTRTAEYAREMQAWHQSWATEALRVLKPGGHLLAFGGTRTYHRLACALEDAGFEIRDCLCWLYGSGFPKSLDVSKAIDKAAGAEGDVLGVRESYRPNSGALREYEDFQDRSDGLMRAPATEDARRWEGWGTALKPAFEPIVLARKPLSGTVAGNVLEHGTGALNIDGCRVEGAPRTTHTDGNRQGQAPQPMSWGEETDYRTNGAAGRWPANVILDEQAAEQLDAQTGSLPGGTPRTDEHGRTGSGVTFVAGRGHNGFGDQGGGASRFFYTPKASRAERNAGLEGFEEQRFAQSNGGQVDAAGDGERYDSLGLNRVKLVRNHHPTVKPVALMRWLVRLVTPPDGLVLDPFAGSGTTGVAAVLEGFRFVGIERDEEYAALATARMKWWLEHGEDALRIVRERERSEQEREAVAASGQLGLLDL